MHKVIPWPAGIQTSSAVPLRQSVIFGQESEFVLISKTVLSFCYAESCPKRSEGAGEVSLRSGFIYVRFLVSLGMTKRRIKITQSKNR